MSHPISRRGAAATTRCFLEKSGSILPKYCAYSFNSLDVKALDISHLTRVNALVALSLFAAVLRH
jgi:hypothetical protein